MKINTVLLVLLTFSLTFMLSCQEYENTTSADNLNRIDETEEFIEPPIIEAPLIDDENEIISNHEIQFRRSVSLSRNLGGGGGPGGGGGGFRYRRQRSGSGTSIGHYEKQYPNINSQNTEEFSDYIINKFVSAADSVFSTFAIDVDTASYSVMRSKINDDQLPPASSVRVEEYINYFDYNYPAPTTGLFAVHSQIANNPFNCGKTKLMRVALRARDISNEERKTAHLTFLIDVSGSMDRANKLPLVIETLKLLVENLRYDDTIAICTYASGVRKALEPTPVSEKEKILSVLDSLNAGGSTDGEEGLKNAYEMADTSYNPYHINRIILCTDGDFNVGEIEGKTLAEAVNKYSRKGITITAVGYGMGNYKDDKLETIANASNGNYFYIDSIDEVKKVFGDNLVSTLDVIAADVKIQLEFNPNIIREYRLVGYETRALKTEDFRNDIVDAGEVGPGHSVTAIYELVMEHPLAEKIQIPEDLEGFAAMFRIRYKEFITDENAYEVNFGIENSIKMSRLADSTMQLAAGVMGFADILRNSPYAENWKINTAIICCEDFADVLKVKELVDLMRKAKRLRNR